MQINKKAILYLFLFFLLFFALFQYGITKIVGFSLYPDEFGYWASAAKALGWDWSETASLGSYYSYGYSILLIPILFICKNSVAAYQAAVGLNLLLMFLSFFLLLKIKQGIFQAESLQKDLLFSLAAVCYPSWIFYMQMTLTEALLMFLFVFLMFLYIRVFEQKKRIYILLAALTIAYLYMVHMRTIGVVIACIFTIGIFMMVTPECRKSFWLFAGVLAAMGILAAALKSNVIQSVYSHADSSLVAVNDYSGKVWILKELLTFSGIRDLLYSILGKIYYLGMASFGIFFWAMDWNIRKTVCLIQKVFHKKRAETQEWFAALLMLSVLFEIIVCAAATFRPGYADGLVYGRYSEFLLPVLLIIGIKQMEECPCLFKRSAVIASLTGISTFFLRRIMDEQQLSVLRGYHAVGISYMLQDSESNMSLYMLKTWIFATILMFFFCVVIHFGNTIKNMEWIICCIGLIEFALGMQAGNHYVYPSNESNHMDLVITDTIRETITENECIVCIDDGRSPYMDFLQMQLREYRLQIWDGTETSVYDAIQNVDYLIVYRDMEPMTEYENYFEKQLISNQYTLYYDAKEEHGAK